MQTAQTGLMLILAFLFTCLALCGASPSMHGEQLLCQRDLADASSLLQQHAGATVGSHLGSSSTASAWSNASLMSFFKKLEKEAETYKLEDALQLYEAGQRLANLSHVSVEEKGLMLLQEAGRISKAGNPLDDAREWIEQLKKRSGKSQMFSCYGAYPQILLNFLGALFSVFISVTCNSVGSCTSEGLESVRYILVAIQHIQGKKSYCAETFNFGFLCQAAAFELTSNLAGMSSAIAGVTAKCPEYNVDVDKKVVGLKVTDIQCYLGSGKGAIYLAVAISKIYEIYAGWGENTANEDVSQTEGPIGFYTGSPYGAFFSQLSATFAWIAQLVFVMVGNCKGQAGKMACGAEIAELVAFISQGITGGIMVSSYCFDPDNRKDVLEKATDTTDFKKRDSVDMLKKTKSLPITVNKQPSLAGHKSRKSVIINKALTMNDIPQGVDSTGSNKVNDGTGSSGGIFDTDI